MKLKFYAKDNLLVLKPLITHFVGTTVQYVGRKFLLSNKSFPAKEDAEEYEETTPEAKRLVKLVKRDNSLIPADEYTAKVCGKEFCQHEFKDGVWKKV